MKITRVITAGGAVTLMLALSACGSDETNEDQIGSEDLETALFDSNSVHPQSGVSQASCDGPLDREEDAEQTCTYETQDGDEYETLVIYLGVQEGDEGTEPHLGFTWHEELGIEEDDPELEEYGPSPFPVPSN